ncbi:MAG: carbohydrate binding family 9 domain-containing protein [Flavobacteriaceae bacterium]|nr:carbohydrate binding family 9 domain-containing protein [Flavobacteriaceae bacterium]
MKHYLFLTIALIASFTLLSQEKKNLNATRVENPPKIDGVLDDTVWESLPSYGDFFMYQPGNEGTIPEEYRTEVKMAYDDKAIYVGASMFDPNPEAILSQFSQRDEVFVQADHFAIALNTYNDGINETHFFVTSAGTIGDAKASQNNFDFGYNVVFECRVSKDDKGWYAEFKIPYNALRFPEIEVQDWGVNFIRRLTGKNESHSWNFIDNTVGRESQYSGNITGISNIDPPVRLTFFPFAQGVVSSFDGDSETNFSAGMDIKYGLSDSFTLDATLIPDFGQVAFDELVLNLGPFEQTFGENRPFFTEGTELFDKANIFFSRRIGGSPSGDVGDLAENEEVSEFPSKVKLLNALKISGRTKNNLGIGVLNAITDRTFAKVTDTLTGNRREVEVEPVANYNIIVFDQQFNNNSSISLINTNVLRNGGFRDANTTAFAMDVADKGNNFRTSGRAIWSNVFLDEGLKTGFQSEFDIFRIKGNFRYRAGHDFANTTLDINDLGLNFRNNFNNFVVGAWYQIFEPTKTFNTYRFGMSARHRRLYKPSVQTSNNFNADAFFVTVDRFAFGGFTSFNSENKDYFEPREDGRFVIFNENLGGRLWVSSDYRKKFAYDASINFRTYFDDPRRQGGIEFSPRYRFSDKLLVVVSSDFFTRKKSFGYIDNNETEIFFGQRDVINLENEIRASYNFDPYKAIDLRFRNFWSTADYSDNVFFTLNKDGSLSRTDYDTSENDPNRNFNIWNLDLSFRWRFAPGSEATLLYRNQIFNQDELSTLSYTESLDNLFNSPTQHTISLRVTYFVDYNNIKSVFSKKPSAL